MKNKHQIFFLVFFVPTFGEGGGGQAGWDKIPSLAEIFLDGSPKGRTIHEVSPRKVGEARPEKGDDNCPKKEESLSFIFPGDKGSGNSIKVSESLTRVCYVTEVVKGNDATKHKYLRNCFKTSFQDFHL